MLLHLALFQALDNVTESKVVMAEARQLLDFFMRKNFINEFGESSMHIMKVKVLVQEELKSSLPGMSFSLWRGLRPSEGLALHKEVEIVSVTISPKQIQGSAARSSS